MPSNTTPPPDAFGDVPADLDATPRFSPRDAHATLSLCALLIEEGEFAAARSRLEHLLGRLDDARPSRVAPGPRSSGAIASNPFVVHSEGRWFETPDGERVSCARRPMLCAVVATLVRARIESPGVPVTTEALIAAAWPGERIARDQARNRLRVGIATLRKLGLRGVLQSIRGAYLFDPDVPMQPVGPRQALSGTASSPCR